MSPEAQTRGRLPEPTPTTQPFWDAAHRHVLSIQRCKGCGVHIFYPRPACPECGSVELEWNEVSGRGTLYSFTIARRPTARDFADKVPYTIAIVELEEGPHLATNVVGCDPETLRIGQPLEAVFEDVSDEISLVHFRPVDP